MRLGLKKIHKYLSNKSFLSNIYLNLNSVGIGNDDMSLEKHFENSETSRGSYYCILLPRTVNFDQIFEYFLVKQSSQPKSTSYETV
jgi:hypothetical protein